nr:MAG: hypothetical protein 1 [Leviviridae sp.]
MPARYRFLNGNVVTGFRWTPPSSTSSYSVTTLRKQCDDWVGNYPSENPLDLKSYSWSGSLVNHKGDPTLSIETWPTTFVGSALGWSVMPVSNADAVTKFLANSAPSTPVVNLPVSIAELTELPGMIRDAGNVLLARRPSRGPDPRNPGSLYLSWIFGWEPLIRDLRDVLDFAKHVKKRQDEMEKSASNRGLRRRVTVLNDKKAHAVEGVQIHGSPRYRTTILYEREFKVWVTGKWFTRDPKAYGKRPGFIPAFNSVYGLDAAQIVPNLWEALPWSWMIDWFANVGDVLQANRNLAQYACPKVCIMYTETQSGSHASIGNPDLRGVSAGTFVHVRKQRFVVNNPKPTFSLQLPFLSGKKLSILAAIAAQRGGR